MSVKLDTTDGRSIDVSETETDFVAVPKAEWNQHTAQIEELKSTVNELRNELAEHQQYDGKRHAETNQRITQAVEDDSEDEKDGVEPTNGGSPLMEIVQLPHELANRECTSNVRRARFIANSVVEYADKCPAGFVLSSKAVRRVLSAADETNGIPHTQTVSRVQDRLNELGGEGVEIKKRHGKRMVVFDEELAKRLSTADHNRCSEEGGPVPQSNVIGLS